MQLYKIELVYGFKLKLMMVRHYILNYLIEDIFHSYSLEFLDAIIASIDEGKYIRAFILTYSKKINFYNLSKFKFIAQIFVSGFKFMEKF